MAYHFNQNQITLIARSSLLQDQNCKIQYFLYFCVVDSACLYKQAQEFRLELSKNKSISVSHSVEQERVFKFGSRWALMAFGFSLFSHHELQQCSCWIVVLLFERKKKKRKKTSLIVLNFKTRDEDKSRHWSYSELLVRFQGKSPSSLLVTRQARYSVSYMSLAWHQKHPKKHNTSMIYLAEIKDIQLQRL